MLVNTLFSLFGSEYARVYLIPLRQKQICQIILKTKRKKHDLHSYVISDSPKELELPYYPISRMMIFAYSYSLHARLSE